MLYTRSTQCFAVVLFMLLASCAQTTKATEVLIAEGCEDANESEVLLDSQCTYINVPLSHSESNGPQISLFTRIFPASKTRRGTVLLLAGGPGESGASFYADIEFFRDVFAHYDLIVPDHRGTGYSSKLCEPEETPASEGGLNLVGEEWGRCFGQLYAAIDRAHAFNLDNAAHDVATVIEALQLRGDTYLYGVSYGTALALAVAERTDAKLTGIMLDSLMPLPGDEQESLGYRSQLTDRVGREILTRCSSSPSCPLGSDAIDGYHDLLERIDSGEPVPGLEAVPDGNIRQLFGLFLDVSSTRIQVPTIVSAMASGAENSRALVEQATKTYEAFWSPILAFDQATGSIPLTSLMSGSEFNARKDLTAEQVESEKADLLFTSPVPAYLASNQFPLYEANVVQSTTADLPPLLVLHGTLDPKTSFDGAMRRIEVLRTMTDVNVITLIDAPHAAYLTAKDCIRQPLRDFVADEVFVQNKDCQPVNTRLEWE